MNLNPSPMKIYLAGPMRGIPLFNFPAFDEETARLRAQGHTVFSPAERDRDAGIEADPKGEQTKGLGLDYFMSFDLPEVCKADTIVLLPGWEKSEGANIEVAVARAVGKKVLLAGTLEPVSTEMPSIKRIVKKSEMILPTDAKDRKGIPMVRGLIDYFPAALAEVAHVSKVGNDQHNPGQPLHHARSKSTDHEDCIVRHLIDRGTTDSDGIRHSAKVAWRALALLQEELEAGGAPIARGAKV